MKPKNNCLKPRYSQIIRSLVLGISNSLPELYFFFLNRQNEMVLTKVMNLIQSHDSKSYISLIVKIIIALSSVTESIDLRKTS